MNHQRDVDRYSFAMSIRAPLSEPLFTHDTRMEDEMTHKRFELVDGFIDFFAKRRTSAQLLASIALVVLADWLFYAHPIGWTLGGYGAFAGVVVILLGDSRFRKLPSILLGVCYFSLCLRAVVDPEPWVVILGFSVWVSLTLTLREGWSWSLKIWFTRWYQFVSGYLWSLLIATISVLVLPLVPVYAVLRVQRFRAWRFPFLLGFVFLGLFAIANPVISLVFSTLYRTLMRICAHVPSFAEFLRFLFWLAVGALLWTLQRHRTEQGDRPSDEATTVLPTAWNELVTPEVARNALVLFNILFAAQTLLDLWCLWGGGALPEGMTHAEYAHRGAYPLIVTAMLAAAFVMVTFREGTVGSEQKVTRWLLYAWLLQNILLVISAGWRLRLYVAVFSLSRLRLAAGVWMFLVACGLIWIIVRILNNHSNSWLIKANVLTLMVVLLCYSCWTPKMFIANFNVSHCRELGHPTASPIDLKYLEGLGYDALPALIRLERDLPRSANHDFVCQVKDRLAVRLASQLRDWRGMTLKRWYVRRQLEEAHAWMPRASVNGSLERNAK